MLTALGAVAGALLVLGGVASAIPGAAPAAGQAPSLAAPGAPTAPTSTPTPAPSPDGTYQGSCDYTLGDDPVGGFGPGTARAIGEVDLSNTGNIGTVERVSITWPQEGYAPLKAVKTVRVKAGADKAVRFHIPMTGDQVDRLQSWQEGHGFRDGCHYKATITDVFGPVSG